jgi:hypothetical protein
VRVAALLLCLAMSACGDDGASDASISVDLSAHLDLSLPKLDLAAADLATAAGDGGSCVPLDDGTIGCPACDPSSTCSGAGCGSCSYVGEMCRYVNYAQCTCDGSMVLRCAVP